MPSFVSGNLLAPLTLASILMGAATVLHLLLVWRDRLRPGAVTLLPLSNR